MMYFLYLLSSALLAFKIEKSGDEVNTLFYFQAITIRARAWIQCRSALRQGNNINASPPSACQYALARIPISSNISKQSVTNEGHAINNVFARASRALFMLACNSGPHQGVRPKRD